MANYTFDGANGLIILPSGVTQISLSDLYSRWVEWLLTDDNSKYLFAFRTIGGDPLPGGLTFGTGIFLQNQNGWRIRPQEADHELIITGNLYPEDSLLPMFVPTLGEYTVSIYVERSAQTQVILQNTGSALTQDEHNRLMTLPTATLETDERTKLLAIPSDTMTQAEHDQLMAIPTSAAGLTQQEHDKLMALPATTLESDERTHLLAIPTTDAGGLTQEEHDRLFALPTSAGLTLEEHNQLMAIPLSQVALTQAEHDQLFAIPEVTAAASKDATLGETLAELTSLPSTPTLEQAIMLLYMAVRNRTVTTDTSLKYHNAAGAVLGTAAITDDGVTMTREALQ